MTQNFPFRDKLPTSFLKNIGIERLEELEIIRAVKLKGESAVGSFEYIANQGQYRFDIWVPNNSSLGDYRVKYKPSNIDNVQPHDVYIRSNQLIKLFDDWIKIITEFNDCITVFDDPILIQKQNELFDKLKFAEVENPDVPFSFKEVEYLDTYYEQLEKKIAEHFSSSMEWVAGVTLLVEENRTNLGNQSKKRDFKALCLVYAKIIRKWGYKRFIAFSRVAGSELMKDGYDFLKTHAIEVFKAINQ